MFVDLHAHFPMHLLVDEQQRTHERASVWWRQRWQGRVVELISRFANYQGPGDTPSVTEGLMREGEVGVALSVLYQPFNEMDLSRRYASPPQESYFTDVVDQHRTVEDYVKAHPGQVAIAHDAGELDELLGRDVPVLIHAIEGGFQLGGEEAEVTRNVRVLAGLGVAYVTLAHLFFRDVAANAPALPFLPDRVYNHIFPQKPGKGLTALGRAAVEAMVDEGILVDVTHMRSDSIADVFSLLDARDAGHAIPVIASHMACRFGSLEYCFDDPTIVQVAQRGGLLGLILCEHFITSGLSGIDDSLEGSVRALCRHIDRIHDLTGSYDHVAVGSDLDGYIKPALPGLTDMSRMTELRRALRERYGEDAEKICSANALRVLRDQWGRKRPRAAPTPGAGG
jgi:microsomal dipeptidase-like Zn-dependent dipeptidase